MVEKAHSRFGGSVADRVLNCAGSNALIATVPEKPAGPYANEGSAAHALAAICLRTDDHPRSFLGLWWQGDEVFADATSEVQVTEDMCDAVLVYLEAVEQERAQTKGSELYVESGFVLDVATADPGEVFGTNDAMVYHPSTGRLVVFDYKHGQGVPVTAEDNAQLMFYAAGAVFSKGWAPKSVELAIVQPRALAHYGLPPVQSWPIDPLKLMDFQVDYEDAVGRSKDVIAGRAVTGQLIGMNDPLDTPDRLAAGSWCKWCDAAAVCPERERQALKAAQVDFASVADVIAADLPEPKSFDAEHLGKVLVGAKILNDWLSQIEEYVEGLVLSGHSVPGWKAVEKIGRAKWVAADEDVAAECDMLYGIDEDKVRPRKLVPIGEAEKLLKAAGATKEQIDTFKLRYTIKESSGLTLAPESDRRPAVNAAARDFSSLNLDGLI